MPAIDRPAAAGSAAIGDRPTNLLRPGWSDSARPSRARRRPRAAPRLLRVVGRTGGRASPGPPGTARDRGLLDNLRACASLSTLDSHEPYNFDHVRLGALERRSRDQLCVHAWLTRREDAPPRLTRPFTCMGGMVSCVRVPPRLFARPPWLLTQQPRDGVASGRSTSVVAPTGHGRRGQRPKCKTGTTRAHEFGRSSNFVPCARG